MTKPFWIRDDLAANAFDPALRAVQGALEPRRYTPNPAADADVTQFQLSTRGPREEEPVYSDQRSAEQYFLEEQCPSDSWFR